MRPLGRPFEGEAIMSTTLKVRPLGRPFEGETFMSSL